MGVKVLQEKIKDSIEEVVNIKIQGLKYRYQSKWDHDMEFQIQRGSAHEK